MQRTESSKKAPSPAQFWPPKLLEQQLLRILHIPAGHRNLDDSLHICLNVYYSKTSPCCRRQFFVSNHLVTARTFVFLSSLPRCRISFFVGAKMFDGQVTPFVFLNVFFRGLFLFVTFTKCGNIFVCLKYCPNAAETFHFSMCALTPLPHAFFLIVLLFLA